MKGTDKKMTFGEVAFAAYVPHNYPLDKLEPGLNENAFYDPTNFTFPAGTYICEVEVDRETGAVEIDRFTAVDDFGKIINPMIVEGQVHGGLAQGIGQALIEGCVYDESGQLLTGTFMDYAMPRADDVPTFKIDTRVHAVHAQPARREGLRRGGRDRLAAGGDERRARRAAPLGVKDLDMPATPQTRVARAPDTKRPRRTHHACIQYHRPSTTKDAARARRPKPEAPLPRRRAEPGAGDEAAPVLAERSRSTSATIARPEGASARTAAR